MRIVVFGLTVSSSWGNGHATLWRGLIRALSAMGEEVIFFERDVPYYAGARDLRELPAPSRLELYGDWAAVRPRAEAAARSADAVIVTSYCPDARPAARLAFEAAPLSVFYDMDTPVTLARMEAGEEVAYLPPEGLGGFDLVLSFTGGGALTALRDRLGARRAAPLYGHVDPDAHRPAPPEARFAAALSYLGTYAEDRQPALERLFLEPARRRPDLRFLIGGAGYPPAFPWRENVWFARHVSPAEHPAFFSSCDLTLNVTRRDMADLGWCPSGRLFEAAACGAPILTDVWDGLEAFFAPGEEILTAESSEDALAALGRDDLRRIARRGRERTLDEHASARRAGDLLRLLESAAGERPKRPKASPRPGRGGEALEAAE